MHTLYSGAFPWVFLGYAPLLGEIFQLQPKACCAYDHEPSCNTQLLEDPLQWRVSLTEDSSFFFLGVGGRGRNPFESRLTLERERRAPHFSAQGQRILVSETFWAPRGFRGGSQRSSRARKLTFVCTKYVFWALLGFSKVTCGQSLTHSIGFRRSSLHGSLSTYCRILLFVAPST